MKIIYISGKYTDKNHRLITRNIQKAEKAAIKLIDLGWGVFTPHKNSAFYEKYEKKHPTMTWEYFMDFSIEMLKRCDAIYMLNNWRNSKGAKIEYEYALKHDIPIYYEEY